LQEVRDAPAPRRCSDRADSGFTQNLPRRAQARPPCTVHAARVVAVGGFAGEEQGVFNRPCQQRSIVAGSADARVGVRSAGEGSLAQCETRTATGSGTRAPRASMRRTAASNTSATDRPRGAVLPAYKVPHRNAELIAALNFCAASSNSAGAT